MIITRTCWKLANENERDVVFIFVYVNFLLKKMSVLETDTDPKIIGPTDNLPVRTVGPTVFGKTAVLSYKASYPLKNAHDTLIREI